MSEQKEKIKIIPCSGIGKVFGLMSREAAFHLTEELAPETTQTVCLAHIVTGEEDAVQKVAGEKCITIDGCAALCAAKSVEHHGGIIIEKFRSIDQMKNHRGKKAGDGTALTDDGWIMVEELAEKMNSKVTQLLEEDERNG